MFCEPFDHIKFLDHTLHVVNMNAQSDGGDLFGGYRPTSARAVLRPIFDEISSIVDKLKCMTKKQRKSVVDLIKVAFCICFYNNFLCNFQNVNWTECDTSMLTCVCESIDMAINNNNNDVETKNNADDDNLQELLRRARTIINSPQHMTFTFLPVCCHLYL